MPLEQRLACLLPNSLHARPATHLQALASRFSAEVTLVNERTGVEANAKSVLALISADIQSGDPMRLRVSGPGEEVAFAELTRFLRDDFLACDEPLPPAPAPRMEGPLLPRSLKAAAPAQLLRGAILCRGLAEGVIKRAEGLRLAEGLHRLLAGRKAVSAAEELASFDRAVAAVHGRIEQEIAAARGTQREVLQAHAAMLSDVSFAESVAHALAADAIPAADAIVAAIQQFSEALHQSASAYLRERVLDLQDIGARLLGEIYGGDAVVLGPKLDGPSIVVAESLTPGQFLALDRDHLRGLVLQHAGATSHTVILARAFGLPTLVGVEGATALAEGVDAILDTHLGILLPEPNEATRRYYRLEQRRLERIAGRTRAFITAPGASHDGHPLPVLANVSSAEEVPRAVAQGAEGVGLFRTEMLFMDRDAPPSEDEQTALYTEAVRAAQGRPVTLRTFDIGGDKPVPYLNLPVEPNPFLGYRGARLYDEFAGLLQTQLRAIFRAAAHGPVRIMAPMIACPEEMRGFRLLVEEIRANFSAGEVLVGMMIEVPSAAFALREFAPLADFFSLGTNDLLQYFFAADRDNARVAPLSSPFHPAFLRFLRQIVEEAHRLGRPVGLCGELGEKAEALPALLGLNLDSISLGASRIPATKAELAMLDFPACRGQLDGLLGHGDRAAVETHLGDLRRGIVSKPILAIDLIEADSTSRTKHEVIKELTDLLSAGGRLGDAVAVEEAVWQREETYSTGFGHGFAVPHCQSSSVECNSIALVRLREAVEWGALDGQPVRIAILIALRAEDKGREHLRIFAKLARLAMNEDFRGRLERAPDGQAIFSILGNELGIPLPHQSQ
jgi:fructose-specific PTS system IIA-like component